MQYTSVSAKNNVSCNNWCQNIVQITFGCPFIWYLLHVSKSPVSICQIQIEPFMADAAKYVPQDDTQHILNISFKKIWLYKLTALWYQSSKEIFNFLNQLNDLYDKYSLPNAHLSRYSYRTKLNGDENNEWITYEFDTVKNLVVSLNECLLNFLTHPSAGTNKLSPDGSQHSWSLGLDGLQ